MYERVYTCVTIIILKHVNNRMKKRGSNVCLPHFPSLICPFLFRWILLALSEQNISIVFKLYKTNFRNRLQRKSTIYLGLPPVTKNFVG